MILLRFILVLTLPLVCHLASAHAQSAASKRLNASQLRELNLTDSQKLKINAVTSGTKKRTIRLTADMEIAGIDLRDELAKENASEAKVGTLIEKISLSEGELRKHKVITWLRIRKLLNADQRKKLERFKSAASERGKVNPFSRTGAKRKSTACDEIVCLVDPGLACCKKARRTKGTRSTETRKAKAKRRADKKGDKCANSNDPLCGL